MLLFVRSVPANRAIEGARVANLPAKRAGANSDRDYRAEPV